MVIDTHVGPFTLNEIITRPQISRARSIKTRIESKQHTDILR